MILRGVAIGGPRDGVMLEASDRWLGTLERYSSGHYAWDTLRKTWVWEYTRRTHRKVDN